MDLPFEIWLIIFSFSHPNELIEISATCKLFYQVSRNNKLSVKKFNDSKKVFKEEKWWLYGHYYDMFLCFSNQLPVCLKDHVNKDNVHLAKSVVLDRLFHLVLPFHVWSYLFLCNRSYYASDMCTFCTKMYIKHKTISNHINGKLHVEIEKYVPIQLQFGIIVAKNVNLFVHANVTSRKKVFGAGANFGTLFYESINSPFLLWKLHLDILCRIVFNVSQKFVLPLLLTGIEVNFRNYTYCTSSNCFNLKITKIKVLFFRELVNLCKQLAEFSRLNVNPYFIIDAYKTRKR